MVSVRWGRRGRLVGGSPFTDSMPDQACRCRCGVGVWVWLGGTQYCCWSERGKLGTLLGPEKTPVGVLFSGAASGLGRLTHPLACVWGGCGGGCGVGVWLCVECCIVDASILLWSSV